MKIKGWVLSLTALSLIGCDDTTTPRPVGYMRIQTPPAEYEMLDTLPCPFEFAINTSAKWVPSQREDCWGDVFYPDIRAQIQFTYKPVQNNLDTLLHEAQKLAYSHTVKADGIQERLFSNAESDVHGLFYRMRGDAATTTQFFVTDSAKHFLRGVVYFYASPNSDSLKPVDNFMAEEIVHIIETTRWKDKSQ